MNNQHRQITLGDSKADTGETKGLSLPVERRVGECFRPVDQFIQDQTSGILLLIIATSAAMVMVNSSWHDEYRALETLELGISAGNFELKYSLHHWVTDGLMVGLLLGKPLGIFPATALCLRLGLGELPTGMKLCDIAAIGLLAGMGFTMSVFIGIMSFGNSPETLLHTKTGIMMATLLAGIAGLSWLWINARNAPGKSAT